METINHECYVSLEVAKLLKEAGFDWESNAIYGSVGGKFNFYYGIPKLTNKNSDEYSAPTLALAQRWLREVKGWDILIRQFEFNKRQKEDGSWEYPYLCELHTKYGKHETFAGYTDAFYKYELALEAGINKCLTLLLKENES